jgi:hypothetical protein
MSTTPSTTPTSPPPRRAWTTPRTECLESRAEISAYAGAGQPWNKSR